MFVRNSVNKMGRQSSLVYFRLRDGSAQKKKVENTGLMVLKFCHFIQYIVSECEPLTSYKVGLCAVDSGKSSNPQKNSFMTGEFIDEFLIQEL